MVVFVATLLLLTILQSHCLHINGSSPKASNYYWALKILGRNDPAPEHQSNVNLVFEIGSRDLLDGNRLADFYNCTVYSFEASAKNHDTMVFNNHDDRVVIVRSAVSKKDGMIAFLAANTSAYKNAGFGSLHEADFETNRSPSDPDFRKNNTQMVVMANSTRLDTFIKSVTKRAPDMICMDCQESELEAVMSAGEQLRHVKYLIFEAATFATYKGGNTFRDMHIYLDSMDFKFIAFKKLGGRKNHLSFTFPSDFVVGNNETADFLYASKR